MTATLKTYFRGKTETSAYAIRVQEPDVTVHKFVPPTTVGIAARLDKDFSYGAIAIMLDCSPSMLDPYPADQTGENKKTRFDHAVQALERVFAKIPDNTYVSLLPFYQKFKQPAEFKPLRKSILWNSAIHPRQFLDAVKGIYDPEQSNFFGFSPIAKAIVNAKEEGFPEGYTGPKLVLALTDGNDTASYKYEKSLSSLEEVGDSAYNVQIRKYLEKHFNETDVDLHVVCFTDPRSAKPEYAKEIKNAEEQFGGIRQFDTNPGNYIVAPGLAELTDGLMAAIQPRLYLFDGRQKASSFPRNGIPVHYPHIKEVNFKYGKPGSYRPTVRAGIPSQNTTELSLEGGDRILLTLRRPEGRTISFNRTFLGKEKEWPKQKAVNGDLITVVQHEGHARDRTLDQLLAIEPFTAERPSAIEQRTAKLVWIENKIREGAKSPSLIRWGQRFETFAPTYRIRSNDWQHDERGVPVPSTLTVWWSDTANSTNFADTFKASATGQKLIKIPAAGGNFMLEDVSFENHFICDDLDVPNTRKPGLNGATNLKERKCLVVRMAFEPGHPCFVQLASEVRHEGAEHRYYNSAGKYTALFWGLKEQEQDQYPFNIVNLDEFKKDQQNVRRYEDYLPQTIPYVRVSTDFPRE